MLSWPQISRAQPLSWVLSGLAQKAAPAEEQLAQMNGCRSSSAIGSPR